MSGRKVKLVYISDYACPWCYIGYRELQCAIKQATSLGFEFETEIRPFMLSSCTPSPPGVDKETYLSKKFGMERWETIKQVVTNKGEEVGINFAMSGPMSYTMAAHRLVAKALLIGGTAAQARLLPAIYRAYHELEFDIGNPDVLADIAEAEDVMTKDEALRFLATDELRDKIECQINEARCKGVNGVPFTIIDGKWAVSGGQPAPVFVQIFNKLAQACEHGPCNGNGITDVPPAQANEKLCPDVAAPA